LTLLAAVCSAADQLTQPRSHNDRKRNPQHHAHIPSTLDRQSARHRLLTMPLHSEHPIVHVVPSSMNSIETRNPENLFGLWLGVFPRCSSFL
jgi:hypothetical protein